MTPLRTALLYAALLSAAIVAPVPAMATDVKALIEPLREGDMRKLVVHATPQRGSEVAFTLEDGSEETLADSNGKIRIVNFWATWCAPCRHEKPALDALNAARAGDQFEVIAIATGRNSPEGIKRFNAEVGVETLTTYLDPGSAVARDMGVLGLPVSILLDREGREIARLQGGADWTSASTAAILDALIEATGS
ncbi:MAG: TlpA disulfide reductase family protein [Pseudomonadota bacterium]